jgi:hypothetical protein
MPGNCRSDDQQDPKILQRRRGGPRVAVPRGMTFKIERGSDGARSTIRLIGSVKSEHLREIAHQLESCGPRAALDLEGVTIVGVVVIHFLCERERQGTELLHCPAYVREWISREQEQDE